MTEDVTGALSDLGPDPLAELAEIEAARGSKAKATLLRAASGLTIELLAAGIDPWRVWYVSGPPECSDEPGDLVGRVAVEVFLSLIAEMSTGSMRGGASTEALTQLWTALGAREREWFGRVLRKKMRVGVAASTLNAVAPGTIREFSLPLCESLEASFTTENGVTKLEWRGKIRPELPCFADVKLDGLRVLAIRRAGDAKWELYTRGGDEIETMPGAVAALRDFVPADLGAVALHGEGYGSSWADSASSIMAKKRARVAGDLGKPLWLFDIVSLDEFTGDVPPSTPQDARRELLERLFRDSGDVEHLKLMPSWEVSTDEEIAEAFARAVQIGEGLVLKKKKSVPHLDRSRDWLKLKPLRTWEGRAVGWFPGKPGTRLDGKFGGLLVRLPETGAITEVGSGFSDQDRDSWMSRIQANGGEAPDTWIEIEGQPPLTDDGRVRFPVFSRERHAADLG